MDCKKGRGTRSAMHQTWDLRDYMWLTTLGNGNPPPHLSGNHLARCKGGGNKCAALSEGGHRVGS